MYFAGQAVSPDAFSDAFSRAEICIPGSRGCNCNGTYNSSPYITLYSSSHFLFHYPYITPIDPLVEDSWSGFGPRRVSAVKL